MTTKPSPDDAWRMFRIMGEFAQGFQSLADIPPSVAIFGSARTKPDSPYYQAARQIAANCAKRNVPVVTGGGPGIMEAGNLGAKEAGGRSVGLCIELPFEQSGNGHITDEIGFHYFFVRKVMFLKNTSAIVVMPGGFGTLDELWETATLVQTRKIASFPMILYGSDFWGGLLTWLKGTMQDEHHYISDGDLDLFQIADSPEEVEAILATVDPQHESNITEA